MASRLTAAAVGVALVVAGKLLDANLAIALALAIAYPLALALVGFYLPSERRAIGARLRPARQRCDRPSRRVHMLGRVRDSRPEPDVAQRVRRDARDDAARREVRDDLGGVAAGDLEADEPRREPGDCGVRSRTPGTSASLAFRRDARPRIRASTRSRPIP